ncbi:MAG: hypothetical protein JKX88_03630 [Marinicaulis sp.]|nr:hypothetical protein [Marinicaulis sp.]
MKRRLPRAVIIAYLAMITAIAPVAFRIGYANSTNRAVSVSQNETDTGSGSHSPYAQLTGRNGCGLLGQPGTIRRIGIELDCLDRTDGQAGAHLPRKVIVGLAQNRRRTPLDTAFASAIAGDVVGAAGGSQGNGKTSSPLSLALAPTAEAQGGRGRLGGPTTPSSGGLPYIFAPVIGAAPDDGPPKDDIPNIFAPPGPVDTPDLVTPIPAALPLLLTGFAGLLAAARRKRGNSSPPSTLA